MAFGKCCHEPSCAPESIRRYPAHHYSELNQYGVRQIGLWPLLNFQVIPSTYWRAYWYNLAIHDIPWPGRSNAFADRISPRLLQTPASNSRHKDTYPLIDDNNQDLLDTTSPSQGAEVVEPRDGGRDDTTALTHSESQE